ncbi:phosphocholine-specific phospholipase C [Asticcacaulis taihuensis]|uniref:phosphocholine-specific phospholipase C n=1 Tax=Asticcacaulis taihuensis TaxID=260084 RepID=UPI003F7BA55D
MSIDRRRFLLSSALTAALGTLPASIARALDIPADTRTGTIMDVQHVVILTQENRAFDHYFGTLSGVRGFSDRFPIPTVNGTVWSQPNEHDRKHLIAPFRFNTVQDFKYMRAEGTPHNFVNAQDAWDLGRLDNWPGAKHNYSLGYFTREDIPFQFALAEAFTICDAYHCAIHAGTNPNRLFIWTGTNDPSGTHHGPAIDNGYDNLKSDPQGHGGYEWVTYPERLTASGISWQIYQDMDDNFTDNPLAGFKLYRMADKSNSAPLMDLAARSLRTRALDKLKEDVLADKLPQVSWIVATAAGSEHPSPSSPAQGADYTAQVLDALTANPAVWARTVFLINFDENDGYFDHVPPPSVPAKLDGVTYGESQIDTAGEYHNDKDWKDRPYGLGPRVPMYVISPWSKGGFVNSQVFDHTSVIRFLETRFGVHEPNISPWRRAVCGDLTTCFDFANPNTDAFFQTLPATAATAERARKLSGQPTPKPPAQITPPVQENGQRPKRPLPYDFEANAATKPGFVLLDLANQSPETAVVFHIYDRLSPAAPPRRYTVKAGGQLTALIPAGETYDLWLYAPNGFYRRFSGKIAQAVSAQWHGNSLTLTGEGQVIIRDEAYGQPERTITLSAGQPQTLPVDLTSQWYDISVSGDGFGHRFAGHIETGQPSMTDPALGGPAVMKPV